MRLVTVAACAFAIGCSTAAATPAPGAHSTLAQAEGPIPGGVQTSSSMPTGESRWYVFYVNGQQRLRISALEGAGFGGFTFPYREQCLGVTLYDTDGGMFSGEPEFNDPPLEYTTPPGLNRFFVSFEASSTTGCTEGPPPWMFSFEVSPASAIVSGPGVPVPVTVDPVPAGTQPNDDPTHASRSIVAGTTYAGSLVTLNDKDVFSFYSDAGHDQHLDVAATNPALDECLSTGDPVLRLEAETRYELRDAAGSVIGSVTPFPNSIKHINETVAGGQQFFLTMENAESCHPSDWEFEITGAINARSPTATARSASCARARSNLARYRAEVIQRRRTLRHTRKAAERRHARKAVIQAERRVLLGRSAVKHQCQ
jgi:hypothetical protein